MVAGIEFWLGSADLEVLGRFFAAVTDHLILDGLPLVEATQPRPLDRRDVDEHVLATALGLDKSVTSSG